jgi:uncharacterized protein (DUF885 family)
MDADATDPSKIVQYFSGAEQDRLDRLHTIQNRASRQARVELAGRGLKALGTYDLNRLSPSHRISAQVLKWHLSTIVSGARHESTNYVFSQFDALPGFFLIDFMTTFHPIRNRRDVENYVARLLNASELLDQAVAEARTRATTGIVPL